MPVPTRDYKRHRRKRSKPKSTGRRYEHWVSVSLGLGDPLPSAVERLIRRSGASIAASGFEWDHRSANWCASGVDASWHPRSPPVARQRRWTRRDFNLGLRFRCWWRCHGTAAQFKAIVRGLRRIVALRG